MNTQNPWIKKWNQNRSGRFKEHKRLVARLTQNKKQYPADKIDQVHKAVFEDVPCLECANCCGSIPPVVTHSDSMRIAKYLGMKLTDFRDEYLVMDEDGDTIMKNTPCTFLGEDNYCSIYEFRPKACQEYPHADSTQFLKHKGYQAQNAKHCPAVFHILERLK